MIPETTLSPAENVRRLLQIHAAEIHPVLDIDLNGPDVTKLDFSANNVLLTLENLKDTSRFEALIHSILAEKNAQVGIGGYLENRVIYRRSEHFNSVDEPRSIHLGIDVWAPAGMHIYAPLPATVHSFFNNNNFGDYGPTIILQHELDGTRFYTLYGHLDVACLEGLYDGKPIARGQRIAAFGAYPDNGDWPPHLHFQIIADMQGKRGDYSGVCKPSLLSKYASLCPDPNLILQSQHLL
jgi:peptidoglycan LD-endopeptidase LytH